MSVLTARRTTIPTSLCAAEEDIVHDLPDRDLCRMIRPVFTELALFLIPFVVYAVFLVATRKGLLDAGSWPLPRILRRLPNGRTNA